MFSLPQSNNSIQATIEQLSKKELKELNNKLQSTQTVVSSEIQYIYEQIINISSLEKEQFHKNICKRILFFYKQEIQNIQSNIDEKIDIVTNLKNQMIEVREEKEQLKRKIEEKTYNKTAEKLQNRNNKF